MHLFELTRALVDTESITGNEERVGLQLLDYVSALATRFGGYAERSEVDGRRANVFACWGDRPTITLSTHMDTVPPFIPSRGMPTTSGDAARATPKATSPPCSPPPRRCWK